MPLAFLLWTTVYIQHNGSGYQWSVCWMYGCSFIHSEESLFVVVLFSLYYLLPLCQSISEHIVKIIVLHKYLFKVCLLIGKSQLRYFANWLTIPRIFINKWKFQSEANWFDLSHHMISATNSIPLQASSELYYHYYSNIGEVFLSVLFLLRPSGVLRRGL